MTEPKNEQLLAPVVQEGKEQGVVIHCPKCGQDKIAHHIDKHICVDCAKAEHNRVTYYRQHQEDWVENAKANGIELWQQQPGETQWEYTVWLAYRDSYPGKRPSYRSVAEQLLTSLASVQKIAQRWSFQVRMQAWIKNCDDITLAQRRTEILDMNKAHVDMASKLRNKLGVAIDLIDPYALKPGEVVALAKLSADMERKARVDTIVQEEARAAITAGTDNPALKKDAATKTGDLNEVLGILIKTGALGDIAKVGIRQTTTTEVALVDSEGNSSSIERED